MDLRVYQSVAILLTLLKASPPDDRLVDAAFDFGRADVLMAHSITGMWDVRADAHENAMAAGKLAEARKSGGATMAQNNKMLAKVWKDEALPFAMKVDADLPHVTRERIAWEIKNKFGKSVPGPRAIADWLQKEAEQPNGPLQSRARKKGS